MPVRSLGVGAVEVLRVLLATLVAKDVNPPAAAPSLGARDVGGF
jgi:hypothetical protein